MSENDDSGNLKKRKKGGPGYNVEASPHKTSKLDGKSTVTEEDYSLDNSQVSGGSSQNSVSSSQHEEFSQSSTQSQSSQEMAVEEVPENNDWTLEIQTGNVFTKLIEVFSEENLPEEITYNGKGYNLTALYDEFWTTFYDSSQHSRGNGSKLPQAQQLTDLELRSIVKIIKRGWEDERYWPKKLSPPFLERCLFQEEYADQILTPDMLLEFIEPSEKLVIENLRNVDQNVLDIFQKYSCENAVHIGEDINDSCIKAANKIMIEDMRPVIDVWSQYLSGLMPISKFSFLMKESLNLDLLETRDMGGYIPAHKLWHTLFLGWPDDKIRYYTRLLCNDEFGEMCNFCKATTRMKPFDASHFISKCKVSLKTLRVERHDAVLRKLETELRETLNRGTSSYFSKGTEWKVVTMYGNEWYEWPNELGVSFNKYPHMLVYSMAPKKRLLLVEYSISWEHWIKLETKRLSKDYNFVKVGLERAEFEVEYRVFVLGSRAVFSPELYDLLKKIFGMKHSKISKMLEDISQEILHIPYKSYKKLELG